MTHRTRRPVAPLALSIRHGSLIAATSLAVVGLAPGCGGEPDVGLAAAHVRTLTPADAPAATGCLEDWAGIGRGRVPGFPRNGEAPSDGGVLVADGSFENDDPEAEDPGRQYAVSCRITGSGPVGIDIALDGPNDSEFSPYPGSPVSLRLQGTLYASGQGEGSFSGTTNRSTMRASQPCRLFVDGAGLYACSGSACLGAQGELPGSAFLGFECPAVEEPGKAGSLCAAAGAIRVEGCVGD